MYLYERYAKIPLILQNSFLQTSLSSWNWQRQARFLNQLSRLEVITTKKKVKLLGYYTPALNKQKAKGLVVLLHGWEGSSNSSYILRMANFLLVNGFEVFRLNFRDHGNTHHLNEGLFLGTLIEEIYDALLILMEKYASPAYVVGFSLGGNFALRFALLYSERIRSKKKTGQKDYLEGVFAISPAMDPEKSTRLIDKDRIFRTYFLHKWKNSLKKKEYYFPYLYNFSGLLRSRSLMEITEKGILRYTSFRTVREYFSKYTIPKFSFRNLQVPVYILTSRDDPIIPYEDFSMFENTRNVHVWITDKGGHNGFLVDFHLHSLYMDMFLEIYRNHVFNHQKS